MRRAGAASVLVYLAWPEDCFRANARDIAYLKGLVGAGVTVRRVADEKAFLKALGGATHVITWHFKREWYGVARRLKVLATPAAGRELIAWRDAPEGVKVHFGAFHGAIMAESVVAFCMAWARGFFRRPPESGMWPREWLGGLCYTLAGTKAVVAGYGRVGRAVGEKLSLLGVEVKGISRSNIDELPDAARSADWFILALPSDTGTDDFLDAKLLKMLPRRAVVVNVGRGNAIDERALARALETGRIAGAYLDVFKNEPTVLNAGAGKAGGALNHEGAVGGSRAKSLVSDAPLFQSSSIPTLISMPHSSAFAPQYLRMAFKELFDDGLLS